MGASPDYVMYFMNEPHGLTITGNRRGVKHELLAEFTKIDYWVRNSNGNLRTPISREPLHDWFRFVEIFHKHYNVRPGNNTIPATLLISIINLAEQSGALERERQSYFHKLIVKIVSEELIPMVVEAIQKCDLTQGLTKKEIAARVDSRHYGEEALAFIKNENFYKAAQSLLDAMECEMKPSIDLKDSIWSPIANKMGDIVRRRIW